MHDDFLNSDMHDIPSITILQSTLPKNKKGRVRERRQCLLQRQGGERTGEEGRKETGDFDGRKCVLMKGIGHYMIQ